MMTRKLNIGVIGPGLFWHDTHKPALQANSDLYEIVAFCARSKENRERAAEDYPDAYLFTNFEDLVLCPEVDIALIITPIPLNAPVAIAALKAGKHVFMEKPMATSLQEADELIKVERETGKRVFVMEQVVYSDIYEKAREVVQSGEIGDPVMFDRISHFCLDDKTNRKGYGTTVWRSEPEYPLGTIFDGGIHDVALLASHFGPPSSLYATGSSVRESFGAYDLINVFFEYDNNLKGIMSHSGYLGGKQNRFNLRCTEGLIKFMGQKFSVEPKEGDSRVIEASPQYQEGRQAPMFAEFHKCLQSGEKPRYTAEDAKRDVATILAIGESLESNAAVSLNL
jgi:predicted dehydrogenase